MRTQSRVGFGTREELSPEIHVRYFGSIRVASGKSEETVAFAEDMTVLDLLERLAATNGESFCTEIFQGTPKRLREDLMVTVNDAITGHERLAEARPMPGDVVALLPLFPGGG